VSTSNRLPDNFTFDGSYCCLGVACGIAGVSIHGEHSNSVLPDAVMEWLGVEDSDSGDRRTLSHTVERQ